LKPEIHPNSVKFVKLAEHNERKMKYVKDSPTEAPSDATDEPVEKTGRALIEAKVATLPNAPDVYCMLDAEGNTLYVGKA